MITKNTTHQMLMNGVKTVLKRTFITLNKYVSKEERQT